MREAIALHIGQAGIQIGNACWELFCLEHGLEPDGQKSSKIYNESEETIETFFEETSKGKYVPRCVFMDLECDIANKVKKSSHGKLYSPDQFLFGKEDAADNFARGSFTVGREIKEKVEDEIRKLSEKCSSLQGFLLFNSVSGGTGSGLSDNILRKWGYYNLYDKKPKVCVTLFPSPSLYSSVVEPYNAMLALSGYSGFVDAALLLNNEAIYDILDMESPSVENVNKLIAQLVSSLTLSMRFKGSINSSLSEIQTNLIPFPKLKYLLPSYAPFLPSDQNFHKEPSVNNLTSSAFDKASMFAKCDPKDGYFMASCLMYRGNIFPKEANFAIKNLMQGNPLRFVDWCSTGFKIGINSQAPVLTKDEDMAKVKKAVCGISNNTVIVEIIKQNAKKFDDLYFKRAFVHWYVGEGMEERQFREARDDIFDLENLYDEISRE